MATLPFHSFTHAGTHMPADAPLHSDACGPLAVPRDARATALSCCARSWVVLMALLPATKLPPRRFEKRQNIWTARWLRCAHYLRGCAFHSCCNTCLPATTTCLPTTPSLLFLPLHTLRGSSSTRGYLTPPLYSLLHAHTTVACDTRALFACAGGNAVAVCATAGFSVRARASHRRLPLPRVRF